MQKLWNLPERPTAVFSANYTLCLGIYEAIYSLGIRIPEDLSVVSFDDFELSMLLSPQLTAVRQPLTGLAEQACDLLLRRMNGDYSDFPRTIRLTLSNAKQLLLRQFREAQQAFSFRSTRIF